MRRVVLLFAFSCLFASFLSFSRVSFGNPPTLPTVRLMCLYTQTQHKKPPQLQPCNGRWLNGGGIWGVRPSGFTREGLRMHRATCAVVGSESLPTHAGRLLVWYGVSPLKNRGYSSFSARRPHQVHLDRMALIPPNALPTLRSGRRGPLRGPRSPGSASPRPGLPAWG